MQSSAPQILADKKATQAVKGYAQANGQVFYFASLPIRPGSGEGDPSGQIVFMKRLDESFTKQVSELAKFDVSYVPAIGASANADESVSRILSNGQVQEGKALGIKTSAMLIEDASRVSIASVAVDVGGKSIGTFVASLGRDVMTEGQRTLKTLLISIAVVMAATLAALIGAMNRFVVNRLARLNREVVEVESAEHWGGRVTSNSPDEVGQLSGAINKMLCTIEERNAAIRDIVQNFPSGFAMLDAQGRILAAYTRHCETLLGAAHFEGKLFSQIAFQAKREQDQWSLMFDQLMLDLLPEDMNLDQLPKETLADDRSLSIAANVVRAEDGSIRSVLVTLTDISALKRAAAENAEIQAVVQILKSRTVFKSFIAQLPETLKNLERSLCTEAGQDVARKSLHMLKDFCLSGRI